ncbi:sulfatase family protein [Calycomorphotria hydatis]|nr:arylsulfatase [Calycomorphotria hydatis]
MKPTQYLFALMLCLNMLYVSQIIADEKPNIVVILADDLGYGNLGCYGATHVSTPNIDQLARQGKSFSDAHSASAVCTPSRYALVTGQYPARHDLWKAVFLKSPLVIDTERTTIADVLKRAGYSTACIGKWHLGWGNKKPTDWNAPLRPGPLDLGFDYYFGVPIVNSHPPFVYVENDQVVGYDANDPFVYGQKAQTREFEEKFHLKHIGGAKEAHAAYNDESVGTILTEKATSWIHEKSAEDSPFFLYLATTNIHHPFTPAKRFQGTSKAGRYGDFIHELDWIVGEVTATLKEAGVFENTLLIFTSDNGGMLNRGGQEAYRRGHHMNGDLFGFKFDAWEGGHRVPFIACWPGRIEAGSESNSLVSNIDLLATVAAVTQQELGEDEGPDSVNLLPAFLGDGEITVREELIIAPAESENVSLRQGEWMLISSRGGGGFRSPNVGDHAFGGPAATKFTGQINSDIADGKIKPDAPKQQLYNLSNDPGQSTNVIRNHPEIAQQMRMRIKEILGNGSR